MFTFLFVMYFSLACSQPEEPNNVISNMADSPVATVVKVSASGNENDYSFAVTLRSPDTGCAQYANWWEVISEDGELIYRRILGHSHVNEQPFTRSGGSVNVMAAQTIIVRAHMNNTGYGSGEIALIGSVQDGFESFDIGSGFASEIETIAPQPTGCAF